MSDGMNQWVVVCEEDPDQFVDLPAGAAAPTLCPIDPTHTLIEVRVSRKFNVSNDYSGLLSPPGINDDETLGFNIGSRIFASDGNIWISRGVAPGAAIWRNATDPPDIAREYTSNGSPNGFFTRNLAFLSLPPFRFRGTTRLGIPTSCRATAKVNNVGTNGQIRLFDITNANIIATSGTFSNPTFLDINLGALSLLPPAAARMEIQVRRDSGVNQDVFLASFRLEFD